MGGSLRKLARLARRLGVALLGTILTLVVLTGVARAGNAYLYCRMADTIGAAPCCVHVVSTDPRPSIDDPDMDCCERHVLPTLPLADADPAAPAAHLLVAGPAALPPRSPSALIVEEPGAPVAPLGAARAGPRRPRSASEMRSVLMVFLR